MMESPIQPDVLAQLAELRRRAAHGDQQAATEAYHLRREISARGRLARLPHHDSAMEFRDRVKREAHERGETFAEAFARISDEEAARRHAAATANHESTEGKTRAYLVIGALIIGILLILHQMTLSTTIDAPGNVQVGGNGGDSSVYQEGDPGLSQTSDISGPQTQNLELTSDAPTTTLDRPIGVSDPFTGTVLNRPIDWTDSPASHTWGGDPVTGADRDPLGLDQPHDVADPRWQRPTSYDDPRWQDPMPHNCDPSGYLC